MFVFSPPLFFLLCTASKWYWLKDLKNWNELIEDSNILTFIVWNGTVIKVSREKGQVKSTVDLSCRKMSPICHVPLSSEQPLPASESAASNSRSAQMWPPTTAHQHQSACQAPHRAGEGSVWSPPFPLAPSASCFQENPAKDKPLSTPNSSPLCKSSSSSKSHHHTEDLHNLESHLPTQSLPYRYV